MTHHDDDGAHQCGTGCGRPAPHTWICWDCVEQITQELGAFTAEDRATLQAIARRQESSAAPRTSHTSRQYGPNTPLNLAALTLHQGITTVWPAILDDLPHRPDAAHQWHTIRHHLDQARQMIHGDPPRWTDVEAAALLATITPMTSRRLIPWLREHTGIRLTPERIRTWKRRGMLAPRVDGPGRDPAYHPADVLAVLAARR